MQRTFSEQGSCLCNTIFQQTPPTWRPPRRRVRRREQARDVGKPMSRSSWNCLITTRSCSISDILTWYCLSLSESLNARVNELTWPSFSWSTDRASIACKKLWRSMMALVLVLLVLTCERNLLTRLLGGWVPSPALFRRPSWNLSVIFRWGWVHWPNKYFKTESSFSSVIRPCVSVLQREPPAKVGWQNLRRNRSTQENDLRRNYWRWWGRDLEELALEVVWSDTSSDFQWKWDWDTLWLSIPSMNGRKTSEKDLWK